MTGMYIAIDQQTDFSPEIRVLEKSPGFILVQTFSIIRSPLLPTLEISERI
jgi:hypothetical protein